MRRLSAMVLGVLGLLASAPAFANDTVYYYYNDAQGSPVAVTDASGNVVERTQYAPYGQVLNRPEHDGPGYTKHEEDAATGLTNMQQRYDDKALGRMLSTDPMDVDPGTGANFNRYAYAADNPYRFIDPSGMAPTQPVAASSDTCGADGACARGPDQTQQEFNKQEVHQAEAGSIEATFAGSTAFISGVSAMCSSGEFAGGNGSALGAMSVKNVGFSTSQQNPKGSSQAGKELSGWVNGLYYCQPNCIQPGPALDAESNRISNSYWPLFFVLRVRWLALFQRLGRLLRLMRGLWPFQRASQVLCVIPRQRHT